MSKSVNYSDNQINHALITPFNSWWLWTSLFSSVLQLLFDKMFQETCDSDSCSTNLQQIQSKLDTLNIENSQIKGLLHSRENSLNIALKFKRKLFFRKSEAVKMVFLSEWIQVHFDYIHVYHSIWELQIYTSPPWMHTQKKTRHWW